MSIKDVPVYLVPDWKCGLGHVRRLAALEEELKKFGFNNICWVKDTPHYGGMNLMPQIDWPSIVLIDNYYVTNRYLYENFDYPREQGSFVVVFDDQIEKITNADLIVRCTSLIHDPRLPPRYLQGPKFMPLGRNVIEARKFCKEPTSWLFDVEMVNRSLTPYEFSKKMADSRGVISPASLSAFEALYMGKFLYVKYRTPSEKRVHDELVKLDHARSVHPVPVNPLFPQRNTLKKLDIDEHGAARIVSSIVYLASKKGL